MKLISAIMASFVVGPFAASPAIPRDFGILTRMIFAADLAEQYVAVCGLANPLFAAENSGPLGNMHQYAAHIREEATASLSNSETLSVLKSGADAARAEASSEMKPLETSPHALDPARLRAWCDGTAREFVHQVIAIHDQHHDKIDRLLATAKSE